MGESNRKLEKRRQELMDHAADEEDKQLNVQRTRRRQEFNREATAEQCRQKTMKSDMTVLERERLWNERRRTALLSQQARDNVRGEILRQKIKSQFDSNSAAMLVSEIFAQDVFNPTIQHSASAPS